jgi:lipooligosaccharide transport system ATP-binding protein
MWFDGFAAVDGIDVELFRGEAFGFLGPHGAGKSSTMRMLGCVAPPTQGDLTILNSDPVRDPARTVGCWGAGGASPACRGWYRGRRRLF